MPTSGEAPTRHAVDTSVAVAALDAGHAAHVPCRDHVRRLRPALAGHAAFETHSVLTRMPAPLAVDAPAASGLMARVFPETLWLEPADAVALLRRLGPLGLGGGATYDALVAEAARLSGCTLLTRDRRALPTYELVGVAVEVVGP
jgi:predicted nucleic acid-binding protein